MPDPTVAQRPIDSIVVDDSFQCRLRQNDDVIDDYAEAYRNGSTLPPVLVFDTPNGLLLVDGFHRIQAARRAGLDDVPCEIRRGTFEEARWAAAGANLHHGLHRTQADKRFAVQRALLLRPELSDRAIAQHTGTSHPFVAQLRAAGAAARDLATGNDATPPAQPPKRIGLDGKARSAPAPRPPEPDENGPRLMDPCTCGHPLVEHDNLSHGHCLAKGCTCQGFKAPADPAVLTTTTRDGEGPADPATTIDDFGIEHLSLADGTPADPATGGYPEDHAERIALGDDCYILVAELADHQWINAFHVDFPHKTNPFGVSRGLSDRATFPSRNAAATAALLDIANAAAAVLNHPREHVATQREQATAALEWCRGQGLAPLPPASPLRARIEDAAGAIEDALYDALYSEQPLDLEPPDDATDAELGLWAAAAANRVMAFAKRLQDLALALQLAGVGRDGDPAPAPETAPLPFRIGETDGERPPLRLDANERAILEREPEATQRAVADYMHAHPKVSACQALSIVRRRGPQGTAPAPAPAREPATPDGLTLVPVDDPLHLFITPAYWRNWQRIAALHPGVDILIDDPVGHRILRVLAAEQRLAIEEELPTKAATLRAWDIAHRQSTVVAGLSLHARSWPNRSDPIPGMPVYRTRETSLAGGGHTYAIVCKYDGSDSKDWHYAADPQSPGGRAVYPTEAERDAAWQRLVLDNPVALEI